MSQETQSRQDLTEWETLVAEGNEAYANQRLTEAELKFAAALRTAEKWARPEHLAELNSDEQHQVNTRLAKSLNNMAALYHTQGKYSMAEDLYNRCLDLKIKLHGEDHLEVALNLHNLAALHSAKRQWALAEPLYKRSLEIREKELGVDHPELITLLNNYALLLKRVKRNEEAAELEARVKKIWQISGANEPGGDTTKSESSPSK